MDRSYFWIIVWGMALGTLAVRASLIFLYHRIQIPNILKKTLPYIPAAVFPALVAPAVILHKGSVESLAGNERIIAALFAMIISIKVKNIFVTLLCGMLALYFINSFLI